MCFSIISIIQIKERLGLSFNNIKGLHKILDTKIPSRASWKHKHFAFSDHPDQQHLIQYRDPIEAIKSLLGNSAHADQMVFKPKHIYSSKNSPRNRIYSEMWTGRWWHAIQVRFFELFMINANKM